MVANIWVYKHIIPRKIFFSYLSLPYLSFQHYIMKTETIYKKFKGAKFFSNFKVNKMDG